MTANRVPPEEPSREAAAVADTQISPTADTHISPTADTHISPTADTHISPTADTHISPTADTQIAPPSSAPASPPALPDRGPPPGFDAVTLDAPPAPAAPPSAPDFLPLPDAERYDIHGELARGGLGRILRATDRRLRRPVALKELLVPGGDSKSRFLREAHVTARLQHPAIIPLYDAGRGRDGELFFSMKLVSGRSLEEAIAAKRTLTERLALLPHVIDVAEAIAYAHSKRIIHRDLKPQNVLVGEFGETVVIDWGIAKDLARGGADSGDPTAVAHARRADPAAELTLDGSIVGTPAYMPPEQARGETVDERADVYALGAILYHLMAGVPPHDDPSLRDILRKLLARPPVPPIPLDRRLPGVPNDLQAIVAKAMAADPADRYPSAKELAADLQKFQTGQIVGAYRYTMTELALRWLRRNRLVASLLAVLAVGGAVSVASIVDRTRVAEERRALAEAAQAKAEAAETRERTRADEVTLEQARLSLDHDPQRSLDFLAALSPHFERTSAARVLAADALSRELPRTLRGHRSTVFGVAFSADGERIASSSYDKTVRVWDARTGASRVLEGHSGEVNYIAASPDGRHLVSASYDRTVRLWDMNTGRAILTGRHAEWISAVLFSRDGKSFFSAAADGELRMWSAAANVAAGAPESRALVGHTDRITSLDLSPDGARLLSMSDDRTVRVWDLATGGSSVLEPVGTGWAIARFSPSGDLVALIDPDSGVRLHDMKTGQTRVLGAGEPATVTLTFSPDGARLATADENGILHLRAVPSGEEITALRGHTGLVTALLFSPDGGHIVSGGHDGTVRLWDLGAGDSRVLRAHAGPVTGVALSPDGSRIASGGLDATVRLWTPVQDRGLIAALTVASHDVALLRGGLLAIATDGPDLVVCGTEYKKCDSLAGHTASLNRLAVSPDGDLLASASDDGTIRLWDVSKPVPRAVQVLAGHEDKVRDVAFSPDGKRLVSASLDRTVRLWDLATGQGRVLSTHVDAALRALLSPDGSLVASVGRDKTLRLTDVATGDSRVLAGHESLILGVAFSPDRKLLASASLDRALRLWDTSTGEARVLASNDGGLYCVAFSPRGDLAVTGSDAGVVRVWDVATGESRALRGHTSAVRWVTFSPDGRSLATASNDGTARLWDIATGESRALRGHHLAVRRAVFSPDGGRVFTTSDDGAVRVWEDDLPHDEAALRERFSALAATPVDVE